MNSNEKFLQKTHGSIKCHKVHPDKPHDGWYELHNGNWCTYFHPSLSHEEHLEVSDKNPSVKKITKFLELSKPTVNFYKLQEDYQKYLDQS